jgi:hypothetical protein
LEPGIFRFERSKFFSQLAGFGFFPLGIGWRWNAVGPLGITVLRGGQLWFLPLHIFRLGGGLDFVLLQLDSYLQTSLAGGQEMDVHIDDVRCVGLDFVIPTGPFQNGGLAEVWKQTEVQGSFSPLQRVEVSSSRGD